MLAIPGRPTLRGLSFWILADESTPPTVSLAGSVAPAHLVVKAIAGTTDHPLAKRLFVVVANGLAPDSEYRLFASGARARVSVTSRTLPVAIGPNPFTIAFGSCYCVAKDRGLFTAYPPKLHAAAGGDPIRFRVLGGDQIYMDLSPSTGGPIVVASPQPAPDPWQRYAEQWQRPSFVGFLASSPNLALADDHEFWNDYPHSDVWLSWAESKPGGPLGNRMDRAFSLFQAALNLDATSVLAQQGSLDPLLYGSARTFSFDVNPLSFFVLDVRTRRSRYDANPPQLVPQGWLAQLASWRDALRGPGVLVLSQPLVEQRASGLSRALHVMGDVNLPDYERDYAALWEILLGSAHDIVVLTGDIHWSRAYRVTRAGTQKPQVWELVSTPFARIPGGDPDLGPAAGKVEWRSGRALWHRDYASKSPATYTTVSFQRTSAGVFARARAWGVPSQIGQGAALLCESTINLA